MSIDIITWSSTDKLLRRCNKLSRKIYFPGHHKTAQKQNRFTKKIVDNEHKGNSMGTTLRRPMVLSWAFLFLPPFPKNKASSSWLDSYEEAMSNLPRIVEIMIWHNSPSKKEKIRLSCEQLSEQIVLNTSTGIPGCVLRFDFIGLRLSPYFWSDICFCRKI